MEGQLLHTRVPDGCYLHTEYSGRKIRAIQLVEELGVKLAQEHPEIADLYRAGGDFDRCIDIARAYFTTESEEHMEVCKKAVGYALRQLISAEERGCIQAERARNKLENLFEGGFQGGAFQEHCRRARATKEWLGIRTDVRDLIRGRGQTPWIDEEREFFLAAVKDQAYQEGARYAGRPNYKLIAQAINQEFHDGQDVRSEKSLGNYFRDVTRKSKNKKIGAERV